MSARISDLNGFITIEGNPISKSGIFEYSGAQIGLTGADATRVFKVYRPAEELSDPACIESFKLLPFINEHVMLGSEDQGFTPPERKGVEGMIGETVYYEHPYLKANLRIVSESLKNAIRAGKIELSPGYRCEYELTPGEYEGQRYDAIQRTLRGNHLALVEEGRTGPDVAVLDKMTFTVDSAIIKEATDMADVTKDQEGSGGIDRIKAILEELKPLLAEQAEAQALLAEIGLGRIEERESEVAENIDEEVPAVVSEEPTIDADQSTADEDTDKAAMDEKIKQLEAKINAMDSKLVSSIADRDALASKLSEFVGTFDSAKMTANDVAKYGVQKLGVPCVAGSERLALDAWLHGRTPERHKAAIATDSKGIDILKKWGAK